LASLMPACEWFFSQFSKVEMNHAKGLTGVSRLMTFGHPQLGPVKESLKKELVAVSNSGDYTK
jgi:hypothetical protein